MSEVTPICRGDHQFMVTARQTPWVGCWHIWVECAWCPVGHRVPGRWWRWVSVRAARDHVVRYLGLDDDG